MTPAEFDRLIPVGTPVVAYPGFRPEHARGLKCRRLETRTRSKAATMGGETVVWVEGYSSCIAVSNVDPLGVEA